MASIENVCSARLISCTIEGVGLVNRLVRTITIKESVCCPYLTGEILLLDNDNVLTNLDMQGGHRIDIRFDGADRSGPAYGIDMYVLHVVAVPSPENFNLKIYTISMVSSEYFTDRGQTVSINSVVGVTGCQLVQAIWTNCFFKWGLEQPVEDSSFQDGNQPYTCTMTKPFSAIGQIRDIQVYPVDYAGNVMLFHNRTDTGIHQVVHAPLSVIYTGMSSRWTFYQRETWGIDWRHMFGWDNADSAIISINDQSRSIMLDPNEYSIDKQITVSTDQHVGKHAAHDIFPGIAQGAGINNSHTSSDRVDPEHDPYNIIARARWYAHCMKAVPKKYLVRVPLKTGLNITVGQGCTLKLQPTRSKVSQSNRPLPEGSNLIHPYSGDYFITDLIHEIHNDLREVNGTTTFNCLKGGECKI